MSDIKVVYETVKQVVIHDISKYDSPEQLVRTIFANAAPGATVVLRWTDGILLNFSTYAQTDSVTRELIAGTLHWAHVSFTQMPTFQPQIVVNQIRCTIVDVSQSVVFKAVARFLKAALRKL